VLALARDQMRSQEFALETRLAQDLRRVPRDRMQLQQVPLNLIADAIDVALSAALRSTHSPISAVQRVARLLLAYPPLYLALQHTLQRPGKSARRPLQRRRNCGCGGTYRA